MVHIAVPRCARCQARNWIVALVMGGGTMLGAVVGGMAFRSRGWTTMVGGFGTLAVLWLAVRIFERRAGLKSVGQYPAILRLREAGWSDRV